MGLAVILIAGLALLIGVAILPTVTTTVNASDLAGVGAGTPLSAIIGLLGICFLGLIILAVIWAVAKK
jgi:formate hydrogenlyase subunit 3/multisubunit Na+/H+ antiporter MnhD subunit